VRLETGRTHQIRVHFLAIGHPVAGDPIYARRDTLALGRQFLHSYRLSFSHPMTGEELQLEAPLPADLAAALVRLRAETSVGRPD
jgi:23S rRNA pseudouridine1911/1915/1917 synthase